MKVQDVVNRKGADVITIRSDDTVAALVALLNKHKIGAVVVSDDEGYVHGIASERDVVRGLAESGGAILEQPVSALMSRDVHTCQPGEDIAVLAERMTNLRIRHLPVLQQEHLAAIISIGDVVKSRLDQLTEERNQLISYVQG
ncbi:MAG TPA: CBS domain-containing protein [Propionibacterium sp.]|jgi:CBS domain-containing protein|nr:CBS domain-containing protein [Propionibacterium sp.]